MQKSTVEIASLHWALGLWWHPVEDTTAIKAARQIAGEGDGDTKYDGLCQYSDEAGLKEMVGLGAYQKNTYSLAAAFLRLCDNNCIFLVEIDSTQSWLFVSVGGYVHPEHGDIVRSKSEIEDLYDKLVREREWDQHDYISIDQLDEYLESLDKDTIQKCKVSKFYQKGEIRNNFIKRVILYGILLAACFYAVEMWNSSRDLKQQNTNVAPVVPGETAQEREARLQKEHFPKVWQNRPKPSAIFALVEQSIANQQTIQRGWAIDEYEWINNELRCNWSKREWAQYADAPAPLSANNVNSAITRKASTLDSRGEERLRDIEGVLPQIMDLAQDVDSGINLTWQPRKQITVNNNQKQETIRCPYRTGGFTLSPLKALYKGFGEKLDGISGLVLTRLSWSADKGWTVKGDIYVK
jgi:hypothetical protein